MRPHELRVVEEKSELDKKIAALRVFIQTDGRFALLPAEECDRMRRQYDAMLLYSSILGERIKAFPPERV